jgi:hypothetical protein
MGVIGVNEEKQDSGMEVRLDTPVTGTGRNAWLEALQELEGAGSQPPTKPAPKSVPPQPAKAKQRQNPLLEDLEAVMAKIQKAEDSLATFVAAHPYLIAPNVYRMWEENLKESRLAIERQARLLRQRQEQVS